MPRNLERPMDRMLVSSRTIKPKTADVLRYPANTRQDAADLWNSPGVCNVQFHDRKSLGEMAPAAVSGSKQCR